MKSALCHPKRAMLRRPAAVTQADVARTIRAAIQAGARYVEVHPDGTNFVGLKDATPSNDNPQPEAPHASTSSSPFAA
jgi:hypothetical protein